MVLCASGSATVGIIPVSFRRSLFEAFELASTLVVVVLVTFVVSYFIAKRVSR